MNTIKVLYFFILLNLFPTQLPYIGGNDPNFLFNNPSELTDILKNVKGKVPEACKVIPGIGYAVLSLRQFQQTIESYFENKNNDSFIKIIHFKEFANSVTKQLIYKVVFYIKTFTKNNFIGVEILYKPQGYPSFEVLSYIMDQDIENVKLILNESYIDINQIFACGDLQEIFKQKQNIQIVVEQQEQQNQQYQQQNIEQNQDIFYNGNLRDIKVNPSQPYNVASTRPFDQNADDPKYYGIDN